MKLLKWLFGLTPNGNDFHKTPILQIKNMTTEERAELEKQYDNFKKELEENIRTRNNNVAEWVKRRNTICPNCSSKDVSNRIQRIEGNIKGESYGSGSSIFGSGGWSSHGYINGSIDTNPINKCNNCQNEWKVENYSNNYYSDEIKHIANSVAYFIFEAIKIYEKQIDFNPNDLREKYKSLEEKLNALKSELPNSTWGKKVKKLFTNYSAELAIYIMSESASRFIIEDISTKQTGYLRLLNLPTIQK